MVLRAWKSGRFIGVVSRWLWSEYERVILGPRFASSFVVGPEEIRTLLTAFSVNSVVVVDPTSPSIPVRDPKDELVLATALEGNADVLVTGDKDLLAVAGDPRLGKLRILTAAAFLDELGLPDPN